MQNMGCVWVIILRIQCKQLSVLEKLAWKHRFDPEKCFHCRWNVLVLHSMQVLQLSNCFELKYTLPFKAENDPTQINNNLKFGRGGEKRGTTKLSFLWLFHDSKAHRKCHWFSSINQCPMPQSTVYPDVFAVYFPQGLCINLYPCSKQLSVICSRSTM